MVILVTSKANYTFMLLLYSNILVAHFKCAQGVTVTEVERHLRRH